MEKVKNIHPSGVVFSPASPPRFSLASVVLRPLLAEYRTPPRPPPKEQDLELSTPPGKEGLVECDGGGQDDLVQFDVGWVGPPGKEVFFQKNVPYFVCS